MFRVAAHPLCAVTPSSAARLLRAVPSTLFQSPRMRVQRAEGPLARVWGEEPQRPPLQSLLQTVERICPAPFLPERANLFQALALV